mmetsp:Transcript_93972/g.304061  ORF Transcript_93972/g.304061 Transcript_93972/m.304061 type:complete len:98 (+) Transcript_93972:120-413(+)
MHMVVISARAEDRTVLTMMPSASHSTFDDWLECMHWSLRITSLEGTVFLIACMNCTFRYALQTQLDFDPPTRLNVFDVLTFRRLVTLSALSNFKKCA